MGSVFLKITVAKYCQEYFPDFTTVEESVLSILNTKKGTFNHMELLCKSGLLKITVAKYCQEYFPDFTTVEESVLSILNTKKGTFNHMELLCKSGQLSKMVISKGPRQIGGENSHATDPGKPKGSHFLESENRDCMPSSC